MKRVHPKPQALPAPQGVKSGAEKVAYLEDLVCTRDCKRNQASCENRAAATPRILPISLFQEGCPYRLDYV